MSVYINSSNSNKKDNEFYTMYEDAKKELDLYDLTGFKVYCPCDTEDSEIVKYLQNETKAIVKYTSDDYYKHEDLYNWCDIIITNPPFTKWTAWFKWLQKFNKKFIILMPVFNVANNNYVNELLTKRELFIDYKVRYFKRPDGTKRDVLTVWLTNLRRV